MGIFVYIDVYQDVIFFLYDHFLYDDDLKFFAMSSNGLRGEITKDGWVN